jgi:hypothetical protein
MKVTTETNCFPHFHAAIWYYRTYNPNLSIAEMNSFIHAKIKDDEIIIGAPTLKANQKKILIDNRWHICE